MKKKRKNKKERSKSKKCKKDKKLKKHKKEIVDDRCSLDSEDLVEISKYYEKK